MSDRAYIYALIDPRTNETRYIGKTDNPERRYSSHKCGQGTDNYCARWERLLMRQGLAPTMKILEECDASIWQERECFWIDHYRELGAPLTNCSDGGLGAPGAKHTEDAKRKISNARKGMKFSDQHKAALREKKRQLYDSPHGQELANQYARDYGPLTDEQVLEILELAHQGVTHARIAKRFHTTQSTVSEIRTGKRYKHVRRPGPPMLPDR